MLGLREAESLTLTRSELKETAAEIAADAGAETKRERTEERRSRHAGDVVGVLLTLTASERLRRSGQRCWTFKGYFAAKLANRESQKGNRRGNCPKMRRECCIFEFKQRLRICL